MGTAPSINIPIVLSSCIQINSIKIVEDNLKSTSRKNVLSANQGRILNERIGNLEDLSVTDKSSLVGAINEIYQMSI
jgi:hypothetical protein